MPASSLSAILGRLKHVPAIQQAAATQAQAQRAEAAAQRAAPSEEAALPWGWELHVSKRSGKPYYFHRATGASSYERPRSSVPPVPCALAAPLSFPPPPSSDAVAAFLQWAARVVAGALAPARRGDGTRGPLLDVGCGVDAAEAAGLLAATGASEYVGFDVRAEYTACVQRPDVAIFEGDMCAPTPWERALAIVQRDRRREAVLRHDARPAAGTTAATAQYEAQYAAQYAAQHAAQHAAWREAQQDPRRRAPQAAQLPQAPQAPQALLVTRRAFDIVFCAFAAQAAAAGPSLGGLASLLQGIAGVVDPYRGVALLVVPHAEALCLAAADDAPLSRAYGAVNVGMPPEAAQAFEERVRSALRAGRAPQPYADAGICLEVRMDYAPWTAQQEEAPTMAAQPRPRVFPRSTLDGGVISDASVAAILQTGVPLRLLGSYSLATAAAWAHGLPEAAPPPRADGMAWLAASAFKVLVLAAGSAQPPPRLPELEADARRRA